jgi:predicted dehydrogenase
MPDEKKKKVRIGFLGVAHFHAESYARAIKELPDAELAGVYDHDEKRASEFAKRYHTTRAKTVEDLLEGSDLLDAVAVVSETSLHHRLLRAALKAKKHILCEKPMTLTEEQARSVLEMADKRKGLKFQMCYVMRYHSAARLVKSSIDEGAIGDVLAIVGTNKLSRSLGVSRKWITTRSLSGGGAVMDHTVHLADLMRWYTGSEVREVYTEIGGKNVNTRIRVEDNFLTTVTFSNGVIGHIDGSWSHASGYPTWGEVSLEIHGSGGMLNLDAFRQNVFFAGSKPPDDRLSWQYYGCDPDREMIKGFVWSILSNESPLASGNDGLEGLRITLASYESARRGRPVRLN